MKSELLRRLSLAQRYFELTVSNQQVAQRPWEYDNAVSEAQRAVERLTLEYMEDT